MIVDELRGLLGEALLERFLGVFAGTDVTFSKGERGTDFDRIRQAVGEENARALCRHFDGAREYIPRSVRDERERRDAEIAARLASGESPAVIARSYRFVKALTARQVRRIGATAQKQRTVTEPAE